MARFYFCAKFGTFILSASYPTTMITISVCMIVKNEQAVISRCLDCVKSFADEIIIVDTGSTDDTKNIAKQYTSQVFDFLWCDDFSKARNYSFSLANCDYIMWLDADDIITKANQQKILNLKNQLQNAPIDCIMAKYVLSPNFYYYRERIVRREANFVWQEPVHEVLTPSGNIHYSDIEILHKKITQTLPKRNLKIYQKMLKNKVSLSPRARYYYARELYFNGYYKKAITQFNATIKSNIWVESKIDACVLKSQCYLNLNEREKAKKALTNSFDFDIRAKTACLLGQIWIDEKNYEVASHFFLSALTLPQIQQGWCEPDYHDYIPYLYLSICYYYLNNYPLAKKYHSLAKAIHPNYPEIAYNDKFFV